MILHRKSEIWNLVENKLCNNDEAKNCVRFRSGREKSTRKCSRRKSRDDYKRVKNTDENLYNFYLPTKNSNPVLLLR